jgi:hypothetical protein
VRQDYAVPVTPYRSGPWPGLTARGAAVLLSCATALGLMQLLTGSSARHWPDLALMAIATCAPLAAATWIVRVPGAASAVAGAYLLPRALLSLLDPSVPLPPLLLVPAVAFDLAAWLRPSDLSPLRTAWPFRRSGWQARRDRSPRRLTVQRLALAAVAFTATLLVVEPAWRSFVAALS